MLLQDSVSSGNPSPLNLLNVGGVFVVLLGGLVLSCFVAFYELLCKVHETSRREKVSVSISTKRSEIFISVNVEITVLYLFQIPSDPYTGKRKNYKPQDIESVI
jgi:hypothetical protein